MFDWLFIQLDWYWVIIIMMGAWVAGLLIVHAFMTRRHKRLMAAYQDRIRQSYANSSEE